MTRSWRDFYHRFGPASRPARKKRAMRVAFVVLLSARLLPAAEAGEGEGARFFENEVRPLLVKHCYECHSEQAGKSKGGLFLDRKAGWEEGGDAGPALIPGDVERSLLIHSVRYLDEDLQMPPKYRLSEEEVAVLERWVAMGAPDPRVEGLAQKAGESIDPVAARQQWAFRLHQNVDAPEVRAGEWPRGMVDRFVLAALEREGLEPAADADPAILARRMSYDLTGLPPDEELKSAFLERAGRDRQEAIDWLVDQLLASPGFGEKFGRHWLDLARYADSNGGDRNYTFFQAWRYRNHVIESFAEDRSYHQFLAEQIAGDLMPWSDAVQRERQLVASGFLMLGPKMLTERDKEKLALDTADEQIDTIGRAFFGLTLGCARCHDHKFDPVTQRDYYALAGFFRSTQTVMGTRNGCVNVASWVEQPLPVEKPRFEELSRQLERLELAMRLKVERDFMTKVAGMSTASRLPFAGVICDDAEAEKIGSWKESALSANRFGGVYLHDNRQDKGEKQVVFRGSLPESGVYEVRVAYPGKANGSARVPVTVEARDGAHLVWLDQTKKPSVGGLFEPVGRFDFEKGGRVVVRVSNEGTDGYVFADAVQFVAERDLEREAASLAMAEGRGEGGDPLLVMSSQDLAKELSSGIMALKDSELAMAPREAADAGDINLRVRGEPGQLGPIIERGFPEVLYSGARPVIQPGSSGRLELASWLAETEIPLLDRVLVNRVWHWMFGRGLVATVDDFGGQAAPPSHPELLDWLAERFRASGGSIKWLVRELARSRAYGLAAEADSPRVRADPENVLFGRRSMRRLAAEEIRDSVLMLAGELSRERGQACEAARGEDLDKAMSLDSEKRRAVYLPVARNNMLAELELFDAANPEMVAGERPLTTVPTQALFLLNSPFMRQWSAAIARTAYAAPDPEEWLHLLILGREASPAEAARAKAFVEGGSDRERSLADLAQALMASTGFLFLE
jgi:hypothetical protein